MKSGETKRILLYLCVFYTICVLLTPLKPLSANTGAYDSDFYYYYSGHKISLPLSKEMIAVRFKPEVTSEEKRAVVESQGDLSSFSERKELPIFKITLLPLRQAVTEETSIQTINSLNDKEGIEFAHPVFDFPDAELAVTDEFIVKFSPSVTEKEIESFNATNNVEIARKENLAGWYVLRVRDPRNMNTLKIANLYYESSITEFSVPNFIRRLEPMSVTPDDTYFPSQWHLNNTGQSEGTPNGDINAPEGWEISTGSSDIVIAIIDEGVDLAHEDLVNKLVSGWDFVDFPPGDNDPSPWNNDAHGTACAGLAAATTNNGIGVTGVAWGCKIMPIRVAYGDGYGGWVTSDVWLGNGIQWAVEHGADVLSNSWGGGPQSNYIDEAITYAKNNGRDGKGCVVVFAAGNGTYSSEPVAYPASLDGVIAVGAIDHNDVRWEVPWYGGSNYGSELDVVAPSGWMKDQGVIMWTTDISGSAGYNDGDISKGDAEGNYYKWTGGTSAATAQVAGLAALILSVNPNLDANEVQSIIESTADDLGDSGRDDYYGCGRINVFKALIEAGKNEQILRKVDNITAGNSVEPNDEIIYTIHYGNPYDPNIGTLTDVNIVDYLPEEADPINPFDPNYNPSAHTYTWNIGTLEPNESNSVTLTVTVNTLAEPLGTIRNLCILRANEIPPVTATEITDVNSWNPPVIYVDKKAPGYNNGMSWRNAYRDLQKALARTRAGLGSQIWVAAETYKPTQDIYDTDANFALVSGVPIYGGFPTGGGQRDWMTNETILDGQISGGAFVPYVVTADGIEDVTLDGFTIRGSYPDGAGIYLLNGANATIANCKLKENLYYGIICTDSTPIITNSTFDGNNITPFAMSAASSDVKLTNCTVKNHTSDGIDVSNSNIEINRSLIERSDSYGLYCSGGSTLTLTNSVIRFNGNDEGNSGICLSAISSATIKNNWIYNNGKNEYVLGDGILFYECFPTSAIIRNNTIVRNARYGINCDSSAAPDINNCIIWKNNNAGNQLHGCSADYSWTISDTPGFFNPSDPNNLHLDPNSPCIDRGDPNDDYNGETDIDGERRLFDGDSNGTKIVDIGADEYYISIVDFDGNKLVNFIDFAIFADANWSKPGDYNWNPDCDLAADGIIDSCDLDLFCKEWLWEPAWTKSFTGAGGGIMRTFGQSMGRTTTPAFAAQEAMAAALSVSAEQQLEKVEPAEVEQVDIEEILKWLDELWLDPEVQKAITEDEWLKFIESVASELK